MQKNEIEKIIHEFLKVGVIHPSNIPYPSLLVMVLNKEGKIWHICPNFWALNKLIIKGKFNMLVIDDLLD